MSGSDTVFWLVLSISLGGVASGACWFLLWRLLQRQLVRATALLRALEWGWPAPQGRLCPCCGRRQVPHAGLPGGEHGGACALGAFLRDPGGDHTLEIRLREPKAGEGAAPEGTAAVLRRLVAYPGATTAQVGAAFLLSNPLGTMPKAAMDADGNVSFTPPAADATAWAATRLTWLWVMGSVRRAAEIRGTSTADQRWHVPVET